MPSRYTDSIDSKTRYTATMDLPSETVSNILCYQPKIELEKARLVCKTFDAAAVQFLLHESSVIARYVNIEKATLLASRVGSFIKTIIFHSDHFRPSVSWSLFVSECRYRPDQQLCGLLYQASRGAREVPSQGRIL